MLTRLKRCHPMPHSVCGSLECAPSSIRMEYGPTLHTIPRPCEQQKQLYIGRLFCLARSRTDLASAFALGSAVIVLIDGVAYEVVSASELNDSIDLPLIDIQEPVIIEPDASKGVWGALSLVQI